VVTFNNIRQKLWKNQELTLTAVFPSESTAVKQFNLPSFTLPLKFLKGIAIHLR
jgi:hypothetical protein